MVCKEGFGEQISEGTADGLAEGESHDDFAEMEGGPATKGSEDSAVCEGATVASIPVMPVHPRRASLAGDLFM